MRMVAWPKQRSPRTYAYALRARGSVGGAVVAYARRRVDGAWAHLGDLMPLHHVPVTAGVGVGGERLKHYRRGAVCERAVDDVGMPLRRSAAQRTGGCFPLGKTVRGGGGALCGGGKRWRPVRRRPLSRCPLSRCPLSRCPLSRWPLSRCPLSRWPLSRWPLSRGGAP